MKLPLRDFSEIVTALKGPPENQAAAEKRKAARMTVAAKVHAYLPNGMSFRPYSALSRDISLTGIGLLQSVALPPKQEVVLALPRLNEPLHVVSVVMFCRILADGLLTVGMEYVRIADESVSKRLFDASRAEHERIQQSILQ